MAITQTTQMGHISKSGRDVRQTLAGKFSTTDTTGTLNTNGHIVIDSGFGFQAVPSVNLINAGAGGVGQVTPAAVTALVGGVTDTSWIQPV